MVDRDLPGDGTLDFLGNQAFSSGVDFEHAWADREWAVNGFFSIA